MELQLLKSNSVSFNIQKASIKHVDTYTDRFVAGTTDKINSYTIRYLTTAPDELKSQYLIRFNSRYSDTVQEYKIRFNANRETREYVTRYTIRFDTVTVQPRIDPYYIRFNSHGTQTSQHRARYRIKFLSSNYETHVQTYRVRFNTQPGFEYNTQYTIKFNSYNGEQALTDQALLMSEHGRVDAIFKVHTAGKSVSELLFVFNNPGKYNLVEYSANKPYIQFISTSDPEYEKYKHIFEEKEYNLHSELGLFILKNIDEENHIALDIYDKNNNYKQLNISKSYFFSLEDSDFIDTTILVDKYTYTKYNKAYNKYNEKYLNFIEASVVPVFRIGADCCFSRKITKTNYTYCSPF